MTTDVVPVAPRPGTDLVPDGWWEATVLPWADEQTTEQALQDAVAQVSGMQAAYEQMDADTLELVRARRVIEIRWGELLGPARRGRPSADTSEEITLASVIVEREDRRRFRKLAEARERMLDVLRATDDADMLTRRALLRIADAPEAPVTDKGNGAATDAPPAPAEPVDESPEARLDRKAQRARDTFANAVHNAAGAAVAAQDAFDNALGTDPPVSLVEAWLDEVRRTRRALSSVSNRLTRRVHDQSDDGDEDDGDG